MIKGWILDIRRLPRSDGQGVQTTVFFKGCPLRCQWCHNPEGIAMNPELMVSENRCEEACFLCIPDCPRSALTKHNGRIAVALEKCNLCGRCADVCAYEALALAGKEVSIAELMTEVEKDRIFFDESGGGVTVSGGEPFGQVPFLLEFLGALKEREIHLTLDTSGYVPLDDLLKACCYVDLFLFDLKMMDGSKHEDYTGVANDLILDNLVKLAAQGLPVEVRIPLIAGINDDVSNIRETVEFLRSLKTKPKVSLLPYHRGGCEKYNRLGKRNHIKAFESPSERHIAKIMTFFSDQGFSVKRGG